MHEEEIREAGEVRYLSFQNLQAGGLIHGFTLRKGGVSKPPYDTLNLGAHVGDDPQCVGENRKRLAAALGYSKADVVVGQQVHGIRIKHVTTADRGAGRLEAQSALPETDGLVCTEAGIVLMAHSADCALLFFHDPETRCIGLAHAGWRGTVSGMGPAMVEAIKRLGSSAGNIRVAVSPAIGPCCYQVGDNVVESVPEHYRADVFSHQGNSVHFDLPGLHVRQLMDAGIQRRHIVRSRYCTNCNQELFFSYRASGGKTGRMAGVISLPSTGQAIV